MPLQVYRLPAIILLLVLTGCSSRRPTELEQILDSLIGAELRLPADSVCSLFDRSFGLETLDADFLIVSYISSNGCTPCHLKLPYWKEIGMRLDTVTRARAFPLLIIKPDSLDNVSGFLRAADFDYPVIVDTAGIFTLMNHLPDDLLLRSFLVDRSHRILGVGNPVYNEKIAEWYYSMISGTKPDAGTRCDLTVTCNRHDFGTVDPGGEISVYFLVSNEASRTVQVDTVIHSCECVTAVAEDIAPHSSGRINVTFRPESSGAFHHPVVVRYAGEPHPVILHLYGYVNPR